jgi:hypothetical protein
MKPLSLLIVLVFPLIAISQTKTDNFIRTDVKPIKFPKSYITISYFRSYDIGKTDTTYCFALYFQNAAYNTTADTKVIAFTSAEEYNQFLADLKSAYGELLNGSPSELSWIRKKYTLSTQIKSDRVTLSISDMAIPDYFTQLSGYSYLTIQHFDNIFNNMKQIAFGLPIENK